MKRHPAHVIAAKRDGASWSEDEISDIVSGITDGSLGDAQLGALLMAICCRGMSTTETRALTLAMRDSGRVLQHPGIDRPLVDKHSTGGVGDKVSLVLAPLVAACGAALPMISGRGLGHTGGTLDKLDAIPGYRTDLDGKEIAKVLGACGFVMTGASEDIAPADRRAYSIRDVSGTVESIPLITASILAKKLAEGIGGLVMDVKVGRAAFTPPLDDARALARSLVDTGRSAGLQVIALLSDMDRPLGAAIGNALEVRESMALLQNRGPDDLRTLVLALGVELLMLGGLAPNPREAEKQLNLALGSGAAFDAFRANVELQGGDMKALESAAYGLDAPTVLRLDVPRDGYLADVDPLILGRAVVTLGGGRRAPTDVVDPRVGLVVRKGGETKVSRGDPLAEIHAASDADAQAVRERVLSAFVIADEPPKKTPMILERVD